MTRAKNHLYLITETGRRSPFLDEINSTAPIPDIDWRGFPPVLENQDWLVVKVSGSFERMQPLIGDLRADSYR